MTYSKAGTQSLIVYCVPDTLMEQIDRLRNRLSRAEIARQALEEWVERKNRKK